MQDEREGVFDRYWKNLGLACNRDALNVPTLVVGAGAGDFPFEAESRGLVDRGKIVIADVDTALYTYGPDPDESLENGYSPAGERIVLSVVNEDARNLESIPSGAYARVISHRSVPHLYEAWLRPAEQQESMVARNVFFSSKFLGLGRAQDVPNAVYNTLREMLRVATPDGEILIWPMYEPYDEYSRVYTQIFRESIEKLREEFTFEIQSIQASSSDLSFNPTSPQGLRIKKNISNSESIG